jgi:hypothetical protein
MYGILLILLTDARIFIRRVPEYSSRTGRRGLEAERLNFAVGLSQT